MSRSSTSQVTPDGRSAVVGFCRRVAGIAVFVFLTQTVPMSAAVAPKASACTGVDLVAKAEKDAPEQFRKLQQLAASIPNGDGLLWKIEKPGIAASYLFGTIHSSDEGAMAMTRSLVHYIGKAKTVATELGEVSEAVAGVKLGFRALMSKVHSDALISSPDDRKRVGDLVRSRNIDPVAALRMPPWLLMTLVSFPRCEIDRIKSDFPIVDKTVERLGKAARAKIVGLETIDEQADALEAIAPRLAVHMVELLASNKTLADDAFATMIALYRAHRPGTILPLMEATVALSPEDKKANDTFMISIVQKRNKTMLERALPLLNKGEVFVAVGALHLVGEHGLVALLRQRGFIATKVW